MKENNNQLICQCCGMPLDETTFSKELNGEINKDYCKWCYTDGQFKYSTKEELIDFCCEHFANEQFSKEEMRAHLEKFLPTLKHWKE